MPGRPRTGEVRTCRTCGAEFYVAAWQMNDTKRRQGTYCSRDCKYEALRGQPNSRRRPVGHTRLRSDGYIEIVTEGQVWRLEHRVVAERALGRSLGTDEHVHHRNGIKSDNRPENLQVMGNAEHQRLHEHPQMYKSSRVVLTCQQCGTSYEKKRSRAAESKYCGRSCKMRAINRARRRKE